MVGLVAGLVACGSDEETDTTPARPTGTDAPASRDAAARFLTQATFGPTNASVQQVMNLGYSQWIDGQWAKPASSHQATWEALNAAAKAANPDGSAGQEGVQNSFWRSAIAGDDQLRQRVAYALSQIFVISMQDPNVNDMRAVGHYMDMLATKGLGNYRDLLEAVALHPMMGRYLSALGNRKADPLTGRTPDENFAREIMQLFSIGLLELEVDGTVKMNGGVPRETYSSADIAGLARVFTGWNFACPVAPTSANSSCFHDGTADGQSDPDRTIKPMISYPAHHAAEEKRFLSAVIPANTAGPASLKTALDTLANHPNVGPFIGRQLIQRLVTSNPSPAYVRAVAQAFNNNGRGVRGDMKAVVKAVLMHPEARTMSNTSGKLREPVLRLSAFLRAFSATSDSGYYRIGSTENPGTQLGQSPMSSPTVFNFYRPGYVPPGSNAAAAHMAAPELQIAHETTIAGYVNYMRDIVGDGLGPWQGGALNRRDVQPSYTAELALADQPTAANPTQLLDRINTQLMYGTMPAALKAQIATAVGSIAIVTTNPATIDSSKRTRVRAAVFLTLVSPEFQVQK